MSRASRVPFVILVPVLALFCLAAPAKAQDLVAYIPHITKGDPVWQDFLLATNNGLTVEQVTIDFYDGGAKVATRSIQIEPRAELLLDLKQESPAASLAVVRYHTVNLNFRQIFKNTASGLAEFALADAADYQLAFKFSSALSPNLLAWSGLALANTGDGPVTATLYALGHDGQLLGTAQQSLAGKSRVVGVHSVWFPTLSKNDIAQIIVRTDLSERLAGIVISGTADASRLLFTPAFPQPGYSTAAYPASGHQLDLTTLFPATGSVMTYALSNDAELRYSNISNNIVIGLYQHLAGETNLMRSWSMIFIAQGLDYYAYTGLGHRLQLNTSDVIAATTVTVPYTAVLSRSYSYDVDSVFNSNITANLIVSVDGPEFVADFVRPDETHVLTLDEDVVAGSFAHHLTRFWLAPDRGILKLESDGVIYEVTGTM